MSNISFHLLILLVFLCVLVSVNSSADNKQPKKPVAIFVFGDSLYDPGNNNNLNISIVYKANRWPYGETFFHYPTGRYSDGRVIPDFIATNAKLPIWGPYLRGDVSQNLTNGANFASGGAGTLPGTDAGAINLTQQLSFFKEVAYELRQDLGEEEANEVLMEAIYMSSIGGNDYGSLMLANPNMSQSEKEYFVNAVVDILINVTKEIYDMGGRKFAFQNVGPVGCLPAVKQAFELEGDECDEDLLRMVQLHNNLLLEAAEELENSLQGFKYLVFDYYTALYNLTQNPSNYGFKVADTGCCGNGTYRALNCGIEPYELCTNPNEYVFFDGDHPTDHSNILLSQLLWNGDSTVTTPYNLKQLIDLQLLPDDSFSLGNYAGYPTNNVV